MDLKETILDDILKNPHYNVIRQNLHRFSFHDAANMLSRFHFLCFSRALWIISDTLWPDVMAMRDATGRLLGDRISLFGIPVVFSDMIPLGKVFLVDSQHLVGNSFKEAKVFLLADEITEVSDCVVLV